LLGSGNALADDPVRPEDPLRQKRLELLESRVDRFQFAVADQSDKELKRGGKPILRWSNPVRDFVNDGVTFLILEGERPRAILSVWARSRDPKLESGEVLWEAASLSEDPLSCRHGDRMLWSPKTGGIVGQPIAGAPQPLPRATQRLVQMRELARRFTAVSQKAGSPHDLRLLTQPLYRYSGEAAGGLDGAIFAFVEGNDPELLLLVEAVADRKDHRWQFSLARMTTFPLNVRLDEREVFAVEAYSRTTSKLEDPFREGVDEPFSLE
jgi:hypothetical protein